MSDEPRMIDAIQRRLDAMETRLLADINDKMRLVLLTLHTLQVNADNLSQRITRLEQDVGTLRKHLQGPPPGFGE
jgi:23S rRNA pseudoU1915 N3-methylase RlmH